MRGHHLSRQMLSRLKLEDALIRLWVLTRPDEAHAEETDRQVQVPINNFLYVKTRVDLRAGSPERRLILSISVDLTDFVLMEGISDPTHFRVPEDASSWEDLRAMCFISPGRFRLLAVVREAASGKVTNQATLIINTRDIAPEKAAACT